MPQFLYPFPYTFPLTHLNLGFKSQAMLLSRMFLFVESGKIQEPIYTAEQAPAGTSNKDFLQEYVANLLQSAFKNLQE